MGTLDDALNGIDNNAAPLKELGDLRAEIEALRTDKTELPEQVTGLSESKSALEEAVKTPTAALEEATNKIITLTNDKSALEVKLTDSEGLQKQVTTLTTERDESKTKFEGLETKLKSGLTTRLTAYGLKTETFAEKSVTELELMESVTLQIQGTKSQGNITPSHGISGGSGDSPVSIGTALENAKTTVTNMMNGQNQSDLTEGE